MLRSYVVSYACAHDLSPGTEDAYMHAVASLERFAGRGLGLQDLSAELLNGWISSLLKADYARITIRNQSCAILTLWRAAHEDGVAEPIERGIRKVRVPRPIPEAWTQENVLAMLEAAPKLPGVHKRLKVPWCRLARAWILVGYYSGLRGCDLRQVPIRCLLGERPFVVRQSKTDNPVVIRLPADAVAAVQDTLPPERERFLPMHRSSLGDKVRQLLKLAGLPGSPKWLRRTGATMVEIHTPGGAMAFLGHRTPGLAMRHYVDQRQLVASRPCPPPL